MSLIERNRADSLVDASMNALEGEVVRSSSLLTTRASAVADQISVLTREGRMLQTCLDTVDLSVNQVRAVQGEQIAELDIEVARLSRILAEVQQRADHLEERHRTLQTEEDRLKSPAGKEERTTIHLQKVRAEQARAQAEREAATQRWLQENRFTNYGPADWNSR